MPKIFIYLMFFLLGYQTFFAQKKKEELKIVTIDSTKLNDNKINVLAPTRAAFYSAIVPGLGQAYNKKYWKIPIIYGALATGIYFYVTNDNDYTSFRDEYKSRLAGNDPINYAQYSSATLVTAQKTARRNRDLSLLITIGIYALNVVDANIDAHLMQFNVNDNLSLKPDMYVNPIDYKQSACLTMSYKF